MIEIEKNIPTPKKRSKWQKYPFSEMEVGDSFLVGIEKRNSISTTINHHKKRHGGDFTCRSVEGGIRVWRIK